MKHQVTFKGRILSIRQRTGEVALDFEGTQSVDGNLLPCKTNDAAPLIDSYLDAIKRHMVEWYRTGHATNFKLTIDIEMETQTLND